MVLMPDFADVCEKAVRRAGDVLLEKLGRVTVREKGPSDLVTEADEAAQRVVRETISQAFPEHGFLGEEGKPDQRASARNCEYRWIVDPLDGTTNYVHQVPHFSVSLALEHMGDLLVGAVFDPTSNECFMARKGEGAYLNASHIRSSHVTQVSQSLVAVGFPAVVKPDCPDLRLFNTAVQECQSMRRTGSAALNLAYVAAGRFDAAWAYVCRVWDFAAGTLLVREAGGIITTLNGGPLPMDHSPFLASANANLHSEMLALVARAESLPACG
jgi:myo-inositol-1(or 4)-monophosphatase